MTATKKENYSKEMTARIIEVYGNAETDEARKDALESLSIETGKTVRSIRMKLVKEEAYVKPAYVSKSGSKPETKSAIVESIAAIIGVTSDQLGGLDKATVKALKTIRDSFKLASEALENQAE